MRKSIAVIVVVFAIVFTPILVFPDSISSPHLLKSIAGMPAGIVTELPKGTTLQKGSSSIKIAPDTVSPTPTSHLHGIVTPLAKPPFQSDDTTSSMNTPQNTNSPTLHWEIYNRGPYSGSFTGASDATDVYTNYLFSTSRSNQLKVDMYVFGKNSSTTQYAVFLFDQMEKNDGLVYSNVLPVGQSVTVTYPNLNPTHLYYLRWSPVAKDQSIDGKYIVHF